MNHTFRKFVSGALIFLLVHSHAYAAGTVLATSPLVTSPSDSVLPNLLIGFDDSFSMDYHNMPDDASDLGSSVPWLFGYFGSRSAQCNGIYYNPAITYTPPVYADKSSYPDSSFYGAWTNGFSAAGSVDLGKDFKALDGPFATASNPKDSAVQAAYYYKYNGTQTAAQKDYNSTTSTFATECGAARGQSTAAGAGASTTFTRVDVGVTSTVNSYTRAPTIGTCTVTVTTAANGTVGMTVGQQVVVAGLAQASLNGTQTLASVPTTTTFTYSADCEATAVTPAVTSATVRFAPGAFVINSYASSASSGSCTATVTTAANGTAKLTAGVSQVTISGLNNANFNGLRTVATVTSTTQFTFTNPDCSGSAPSGGGLGAPDERTNFANWYSYYRSRMLMMKTAMGHAFKEIDDKYRVGFMSMNTAANFLNIKTFDPTHKGDFYTLLYGKATSGSTPGRRLLADMGKYFANKLTLSGVTLTDPMQYSCQQNFGIFATDGFWNAGSGTKLNGDPIGNEDGLEPRPYSDGSTVSTTAVTPSVTTVRQSTAQPIKTTIDWTRNRYVASATMDCSTSGGASTGRSGATGNCVQDAGGNDNSDSAVRTWCVGNSSNPGNHEECTSGKGTTIKAYACRGASGTTGTPTAPHNTGCAYDGAGQRWCVFATTSGTSSYSCSYVHSNNALAICKAEYSPPNNGYTVTTTPQTYQQLKSGAATTTVTDTATTVNTSVTTVNGVAQPAIVGTPAAGPAVVTTPTPPLTEAPSLLANPSTTAYSSDTGAPGGSPTVSNGSATTQCVTDLTTVSALTTLTAGGTVYSAFAEGSPQLANDGSSTVTTLATTGPVAGTTVTSGGTASGGTSDNMADVAEYYYVTDLRTTALGNCAGSAVAGVQLDVCTNDVPVSGNDANSQQHMTTFTIALGARGRMLYSPTYQSDASGDFFAVKTGAAATASVCAWQAVGTVCNWPAPGMTGSDGLLANIDDTWHAAVNGRGQYFSATDPQTLKVGLQTALAGVQTRTGSSAAATTSNPNVTSGDNFVFSSTFTTQDWDGQLVRQQLDLVTGVVSSTIDWTAQSQLDSLSPRKIYTRNPDNTSGTLTGLMSFTYANLGTTDKTYFESAHIAGLSQFCATTSTCLSATSQGLATEATLVDYLRGDRTNEGTLAQQGTASVSTPQDKYFRLRKHLLGDIVNAEAVYVKVPLLNYSDNGFATYITTAPVSTRQGQVYVASNDGMLHAFNSSTGAETFAYVPTFVFPQLYKLADKNYGTTVSRPHQYFVDGTPVSGDIYYDGAWRTIVVAGLNGGGKGYYALDVTDPTNPKSLWEFTDVNMGYAYGNPIITKLKDCDKTSTTTAAATCTNPAGLTGSGTWVVLLTSGYNNDVSADGQDGKGHLYVLNAGSGALIRDISTGFGDTDNPSGLAKINAWVDNTSVDNTTLRVYGGDLLGNVWRFDVNNLYDTSGGGYKAHRLITLYADDAGTVPQPITTKPEIGEVNGTAVVYVGTGRYLAAGDLGDTTRQSFYGFKDGLGTTSLPTPRSNTSTTASESVSDSGAKFVKQDLTITTCPTGTPTTICSIGQIVRTSTTKKVTFPANNGWYIDLPELRERANTDPTLALGTLGFTTNVPNISACTAGGTSFRYLLDYKTGGPLSTSTTKVSGIQLGSALATRAVFVRLPNNTVVQLTRMSDGTTLTTNVPIGAGASAARRISWRELITEQ